MKNYGTIYLKNKYFWGVSMASNTGKMGFWSVFFLGVNGIIGSGIFLLPGNMYKLTGNNSIWLVALAGLSALTIALCFADMASRFTGNGAAWLYTYNAFGRFPGFEIGFFSWIQGVITIAAEVAAFLSVLREVVPAANSVMVYNIIGTLLIVGLAVLNLLGPKFSDWSDNVATVMKMLVLAVFIIIGIWSIKSINFSKSGVYPIGNYNNAFNIIFYMFSGFSFLPIAASDMKNSEKNLPRALISVIITVTAIYALTQFVAIGVLGTKIMSSNTPLALALAVALGPVGKLLIVGGMLISILGVAISVSFSTPFVASSLANEHQLLPSILGIKTKEGTPWVAIAITSGLSILLLLSGSYLFLVSSVVVVSLIQYIATSLATIKIQRVDKSDKDGWRLPGGMTIPIIAILLCLYIFSGITFKVVIFGIVSALLGIILYALDDHKAK
ncbi:APC family permease [Pediococcus claussenii]|nr:APC family permease [Pediococcus claussenii]KRN21016.1 hypothetical protein IV79_GL000242 [Pediococcus claussenii]